MLSKFSCLADSSNHRALKNFVKIVRKFWELMHSIRFFISGLILEGVYMRPEMKFTRNDISFWHEKKFCSHYFSLRVKWNRSFCLNLLICLSFYQIFAGANVSFRKIHFGVVFIRHLSLEMKIHIYQNDCNETTTATSFISGYFMWTVMRLTRHRIENISIRPKWNLIYRPS